MKIYLLDIKRFKYMVLRDFKIQTGIKGYHAETPHLTLEDDGMLTVRAGYLSDGPSGPTLDDEHNLRAACGTHDPGYDLMSRGLIPYDLRDAWDDLLREVCLRDGMDPVRAQYYHDFVRMFGGKYAEPGSYKPDKIYEVGRD